MKFLTLASFLAACSLLISCAEKRPAPPRGKRIGLVKATEGLRGILNSEKQLETDDHCLMVVELNDKSTVVEISTGECPTDGKLGNPVVTLKLWNGWAKTGERLSTLLLTGDSSVQAENTPVGVVSDVSTSEEEVSLELDQLCQGNSFMRINLADNCSIKVSDQGHLISMDYNPRNTLQSHLLARANDADKRLDGTDSRLNGVDATIAEMKGEIVLVAAALLELANGLESFQKEVAQVLGAITTTVSRAIVALAEKIDQIEKDSKQALIDLQTSLSNEADKARKALEEKLQGEMKSANEEVKKTLRREMNEQIAASENKIRQSMTTIQTQIETIKEVMADLSKDAVTREELNAGREKIMKALKEAKIAQLETLIEIYNMKIETANAQANEEGALAIEQLKLETQKQIDSLKGTEKQPQETEPKPNE